MQCPWSESLSYPPFHLGQIPFVTIRPFATNFLPFQSPHHQPQEISTIDMLLQKRIRAGSQNAAFVQSEFFKAYDHDPDAFSSSMSLPSRGRKQPLTEAKLHQSLYSEPASKSRFHRIMARAIGRAQGWWRDMKSDTYCMTPRERHPIELSLAQPLAFPEGGKARKLRKARML